MGILYDIFKLLFSKDLHQVLKKNFKNEPEWKKERHAFNHQFDGSQVRDAGSLISAFPEVLIKKGWEKKRADIVRFVIQEIVNNSFIHGISNKKTETVYIKAELTKDWTDCEVSDTGTGFDLAQELISQEKKFNEGNLLAKRGLLMVKDIVTNLTQKTPSSITLTVTRKIAWTNLTEKNGVFTFSVEGEIDTISAPSLRDRLSEIKSMPPRSKILVDLTELFFIDSFGTFVLIDLFIMGQQNKLKIVFLLEKESSVFHAFSMTKLDKSLPVVTSYDEAFNFLNENE